MPPITPASVYFQFNPLSLECAICFDPNALDDSSVDHSRSSKASEDPSAGAPSESPKAPEE
jgi:hypothetical protein